ncbi:MAG: hypothetical protein F6K56_12605 [Moorea sp. SIO3G5]|nr:hypothetical protein [Moorena sp. SIO3G5]
MRSRSVGLLPNRIHSIAFQKIVKKIVKKCNKPVFTSNQVHTIFPRFPIPDSRFPFPSWEGLGVGSDSQFPTPDSLLPTPYSLLPSLAHVLQSIYNSKSSQ